MLSNVIVGIALVSVVWGVVSAIAIASYLSNRGRKINIIFFRILILQYIHEYYEITKQENGKPGGWFYSYVGSMNLALVMAVIGLALGYGRPYLDLVSVAGTGRPAAQTGGVRGIESRASQWSAQSAGP